MAGKHLRHRRPSFLKPCAGLLFRSLAHDSDMVRGGVQGVAGWWAVGEGEKGGVHPLSADRMLSRIGRCRTCESRCKST